MTTLETLLIIIVWIGYGVFSAYQAINVNNRCHNANLGIYVMFPILSPIILIARVLLGIFHHNIFKS